jgi:uncharacterized phage protein (TIGR01671 family)
MISDIKIEKREKRYRAWDHFQKKMIGIEYNQENIGILPSCDKTGTTMYHSNGNITLINISYDGYDIMEFIGKCDKNNKYVYEFDIIKWREQFGDESDKSDDSGLIIRNDYILGMVVWDKEVCGFIVEQLTKGVWINKICDCTFKYDTEFYSLEGQSFHWEDVEIIGDKYQNADLLENR